VSNYAWEAQLVAIPASKLLTWVSTLGNTGSTKPRNTTYGEKFCMPLFSSKGDIGNLVVKNSDN
jgi:hypothetical protein